ncbi:hypothetical protein F5887DRAFT_1078098 [Amanita rubescens]|nr:hypothetical protein F5887DRAFT_1078098 [Amanita rubescens]
MACFYILPRCSMFTAYQIPPGDVYSLLHPYWIASETIGSPPSQPHDVCTLPQPYQTLLVTIAPNPHAPPCSTHLHAHIGLHRTPACIPALRHLHSAAICLSSPKLLAYDPSKPTEPTTRRPQPIAALLGLIGAHRLLSRALFLSCRLVAYLMFRPHVSDTPGAQPPVISRQPDPSSSDRIPYLTDMCRPHSCTFPSPLALA